MNKHSLIGLLSACVAIGLAPACADDAGTSGTSGADSMTETGGDGDGDTEGDEDSTTNMSGDGDGDPAVTETDTEDTDSGPPDSESESESESESDTDPTDTTDTEGDGDGDGGDGDGDGGDGDGDGGDGDGDMGNDVCGDGMVTGNEACDDGVNDGSYGGCAEDCSTLGPFCGDGELNGPEGCDDANDDSADGCLGDCTVPGSCLEILNYDDMAADGEYVISPKPDTPWTTTCDMTTDGGGWTALTLEHTCNGDLDSTLTAIEAAPDEGVDMDCRAFTTDAGGSHTYLWEIEFLPGYDEFWLADDYTTKARAIGPDTSEINSGVFIQSSWDDAHGGTARGDVSFGSSDDPGPTTSYASEGANFECVECEELFPTPMTPFMVGANSTIFAIGWGEGGSQDEGWYPWWAGAIYIR